MQRLKRVFNIDIEHCGVCVAARCAASRASTLPRSSRGSSLISPPARPAPSATPAHPRSVWAPRNPAPPITDPLLTAPTGAPRPRCASSTALRPTPCLTRSHHCRLHKISSPRPRNVCARTDNVPDNVPDNDHASSTTPLLLQQRRSAGYFAYPYEATIADAVPDRIVLNAYRIELTGEFQRKRNKPPPLDASDPEAHQAVTMWTRPADRAPSYGTYGQGVDKCAALAHPLPTLATLATTSSPLQPHDLRDNNARAPSAPCLMRSSPLRSIPHCTVTRVRLRSRPAGRWPAPSSTRGETTPQTREREAPPRPVRAGRNRGQITQESRSSVPGIAVKCAGIRREETKCPFKTRRGHG